MNTEAFLLIGKLAENEKVIKEIIFTSKGFKVRWAQEKALFNYKFTEESIINFLELYETYE
ncbi:hypothetical protein [Flavobacterium phage FL-1]|nr:hypothetical protein [Flavobacterium phage FL-1]